MLIKGGAAKKPPEARLKGPEELIKIRTGPPETELKASRPCTPTNLFRDPALEPLL